MCDDWRLIELTNGDIGAVSAGGLIPLGAVTRRVSKEPKCTPTFEVGTTANNVVTISEPGIYNVIYTGSLIAGAAGNLSLNLLVDGDISVTRTSTAAESSSMIYALAKEIRVRSSCCNGSPVTIALSISGIAITGGNGSLIISRQTTG